MFCLQAYHLVMTQEQPYTVVRKEGDLEIREYPASVHAQLTLSGSANTVGNKAFGSLVGYISSNNIAMTSPVIQERNEDQWNVSFVMPAGMKVSEMPQPTNGALIIREVPAHLAGATRWSGSWKYAEVQKRSEEMGNQLIDLGYRVSGEPRWARYDPPWKPWFMRRNEVIVPILPA
jgi:hypothetical protein